MSDSVFSQYFAKDFTGLDGLTSSLEQDKGVNRAVNYEMSVGNSLRGRVGCQTAGSHGFFAIFPYRYTRTQDQYDILYQTAAGTYPNQTPSLSTTKTTADGASVEKLIALNTQAWTLDTMDIVATYVSGAYPFTWYTYVNGTQIYFQIKANGISILNYPLGDGIYSATSYVSIKDLLDAVDGIAELSIANTRSVRPPFAIANGNQTATFLATEPYGTRYQLTVDAGHTFSIGDIFTCYTTGVLTGVNYLAGGIVTGTSVGAIQYIGKQVTVVDNQVLGYQGQAAANFFIDTAQSDSSGNLTLSLPYWRLIPEGDADFGNIFRYAANTWFAKTNSEVEFYAPPVAVNDSGNLYLTVTTDPSLGTGSYSNALVKCDGKTLVKAGLPVARTTVTAIGAGALTGTYKYKGFFRRVDAQGNITEGPVSTVTSTSTVTYAAQYGRVTSINGQVYTAGSGFQTRSGYKHTTESPASGAFFYVDDVTAGLGNTTFIQPGDPICLTDNTAQKAGLWVTYGAQVLGTVHKTVCTGFSAQAATISPTFNSIRVADSSGYTINGDTEISTGLTYVSLRTTAGGNQFYVLAEVPVTGFGSIQFFDDVTDAVLTAGEQYIEIDLGKEHDPPPACTLVCQHQGGLVVARGPTSPNTVAFSSADGIEYFPTASNSFDVPSTQSGFITAIVSDTDDRLAVFKDRAYYDVYGDLDGGSFSINVRNEGDYGITSQASLVRIPIGLLGLSKNGFVVVSDGLLDPFRFQDLNARIVNQAYQFSWATAVNDYFNRQYICTIPLVSGEPVGFSIDYSRPVIKTFERSYATKIDQAGGGAMVGDTLYHLSATSPYGVFRRLVRFDGNSPSGNGDGDSFIDNTGAISYIFESQPINLKEPAQLKTPIRVRVWSIPNDYVEEGWVPFSISLETGASPIASYVGSGNNNGTTGTLTFSTANDVFEDLKLVNCKTHFYIIRFTTNTIRTAPFITGYEILFKDNYRKEDLIK